MSIVKNEKFTPKNVTIAKIFLAMSAALTLTSSSFSMRQGLPFLGLEKLTMDILPQIIPVLELVGIWAIQMSL